jgi:small subunit ribosomal protein S5
MVKEDIKKTAEAYGSVSEEKAREESENPEKVTQEMIEKETAREKEEREAEIKEREKKEKEKEEKVKEKEKTEEEKFKEKLSDEKREIYESWEPRTKLGKEVKYGKIKDIDEILDADRKILEEEIVEYLLPIKTDLIAIGQSKGKFGGGKRRAWRQTQRITKEGGVMTFSSMAVAGDGDGHVGLGNGKAQETLPARDKGIKKAKLNIQKVTRGCSAFDCSCSEKHSIPFAVEGKSGSVRIKLIPAPQGTGLVCAKELKKIFELAGIKDIYSKTSGQVRTTFNLVKACINALEKTNRKNKTDSEDGGSFE